MTASQDQLARTQRRSHSQCVVCGDGRGLALNFSVDADGTVRATFECQSAYQGYDGLLHGGVIALLLDGAMTNCLFAHGVAALTAEMKVRYRHPVRIGQPVLILARIVQSSAPLFLLESQLFQSGLQCARGTGKFMQVST